MSLFGGDMMLRFCDLVERLASYILFYCKDLTMIPWRLKALVSARFPLAYHLLVNIGTRGNNRVHWDEALAKTWHQRTWPTKNQLIESLTSKEDVILDVACGNGSILRYLQSRGYRNLEGLEISEYAVNRLNSEGILMHRGMLPRLVIPDASYNVVIASQVLEHVIRRRTLVREIRRVLKPGGRAFIFVPDNCLGPIDEPEHVMVYTAGSLKRFLSSYFLVLDVRTMKDENYEIPILFAQVVRRP